MPKIKKFQRWNSPHPTPKPKILGYIRNGSTDVWLNPNNIHFSKDGLDYNVVEDIERQIRAAIAAGNDKDSGIINRPTVYYENSVWFANTGRHRLQGAIQAGLQLVHCKQVAEGTTALQLEREQLVENSTRRNVAGEEQTRTIIRLREISEMEKDYKRKGDLNKDVAQTLNVSERTVERVIELNRLRSNVEGVFGTENFMKLKEIGLTDSKEELRAMMALDADHRNNFMEALDRGEKISAIAMLKESTKPQRSRVRQTKMEFRTKFLEECNELQRLAILDVVLDYAKQMPSARWKALDQAMRYSFDDDAPNNDDAPKDDERYWAVPHVVYGQDNVACDVFYSTHGDQLAA